MKRFYEQASAEKNANGLYTVTLDGRPIKTTTKQPLHLPTLALAKVIADEWQAQGDKIKPEVMPFTTLANPAIDRVMPLQETIALDIASFGGSDLVCYRAEHPESLISRQNNAWQPLVEWVQIKYGIHLKVTAGVVHVAQSEETLRKFNEIVLQLDAFQITTLHEFTNIAGSLVIALAIIEGHLSPEDGYLRSQIDESYQAEMWGADEEASERAQNRYKDFMDAHRFLTLLS